MKKISAFLLKIFGWKTRVDVNIPDKAVICIAPHTSNQDFFLGKLFASANGIKSSFFIKKSWFIFPFNLFFKPIGGIPVDRSKKTSLVEQLVEKFNHEKRLLIAITPEATRKANTEWKRGFYYIALNAHVPILLAYIDYALKEIGITNIMIPTGDIEKELRAIKLFYKSVTGRHPERFETGE